jgi:hypothetical protein
VTYHKLTAYLSVTSLLLLNNCSGSHDSNSIDWTKGRGTAACQEWQQSLCNWASRCNLQDITTCATQNQQIECSSDTTAANCATSFDSASCSTVPAGCNVTDTNGVVNAAPAIQGCNDWVDAICSKAVSCGAYGTTSACQTDMQSSLDCSTAIGLGLHFQDCMTQTAALTCSSTSTPAVCEDTILVIKSK